MFFSYSHRAGTFRMQTMQLTHFFLTASLLIALNAEAASQGLPPVHVFAQLEGTWQGSFVGYDEHGKELYRERVHKQGRATIYLIDGVGRYGGRLILMSGSYRRQ